jgi:hypothetical protein
MNYLRIYMLFCMLSLVLTKGHSQEKTKKELKEEAKIERQKEIDSLVNSRTFVFVAATAYPQGYRSVNLTTNPNFIKFSPHEIESDMPFYGKSYSGVAYSGDGGIKFTGTPEEYTVTKNKKNYQVTAIVKGENDTYHLFLTVGFEGTASISITSNNRSSISFSGDISVTEK